MSFFIAVCTLSAFSHASQKYLRMAVQAYQERMYPLSIEQLDKFYGSGETENRDYARLLHALNLIKLHDCAGAEDALKRLIDGFPESQFLKDGMLSLILLYLKEGEINSSVATYETYRRKFGVNNEVERQIASEIFRKGVILFNSGKGREGKEYFTKLTESIGALKDYFDQLTAQRLTMTQQSISKAREMEEEEVVSEDELIMI